MMQMISKKGFTRVLAIIGTIFVWLPIIVPVIFSAIYFFSEKGFLFDYLMPAELFPVFIIGCLLLIWAAARIQNRLKFFIIGTIAAVGLIVGSQALAIVTGLASGEAPAAGIRLAAVLSLLILYNLMVITIGIEGILLTKDTFKNK